MFWVSFFVGFLAIILAVFFIAKILKRKVSSKIMAEVAENIKIGANAYFYRQIKTILFFTPLLFLTLFFLLGWKVALTSVFGVITSLTAAFVGMSISVRANLHTADLSQESPVKSFQTAVMGGSVMGLCVTGFSLVLLSILFLIFNDPNSLIGFGFGASLAALFAQIGGGIFTKSADIGADLVGKVEKKIPEDDPRNAAVVADLVGDNVGDCAGRGADLFQTFSDDIVTGSLVAATLISKYGIKVIYFPILLQCVGVLSSAIGILAVREWRKRLRPESIFNIGLVVSAVLSTITSFILAKVLLDDISLWLGAFLGIMTTLVAAINTWHYVGMNSKPVRNIALASKRGPALSLITALAYGLRSPIASIIMIITAIALSFKISGGSLLGVVTVNIGTDLLIAYIMASDAFGPIVDNATGIAEMAKAPAIVVSSLSSLDSVGNTMKAITKAYAMSSGTITAFVIFVTFFSLTKINSLEVITPFNLGFLFLGISLPFLIASLTIDSTAKGAMKMVDEVRRQFREIKGLLEGKVKPDYTRCIDIATKNALREMVLPGVVCLVTPVIVGLLFGANALGSLLIGSVASAALLGPFFNNFGTALDNAKKLIENNKSGEGTFEHAAAVVGDTVGDPLKDVAGPSLLIFMKLIGMTALLVTSLL